MARTNRDLLANPLLAQLRWFITLRWLAGLAVIVAALVDSLWLNWFWKHELIAVIGAVILGYNVLLWIWTRRLGESSRLLVLSSWVQIVLDLGCLTLITLYTGGAFSPLLAFYVFHMVFASLLLPQRMAYGGAAVAILMLVGGLWASNQLPESGKPALVLCGWIITLLLTVYLANEITRNIQRQWRRLVKQNDRIRLMSRRLRLQQQAMIQQEKMAAVGQMAAGVAHEISNPMASMDSLLQLVKRRPDRLNGETIDKLREQVARISGIVRQMNTFSHPAETEARSLRVDELVEEALLIVRFDRRMKRVKVEKDLQGGQCRVLVQPEAVGQVLVNLILNALDAMSDTENPRLILRTRCDQKRRTIEVQDNGHGISPEHMERLFEPFFTTKPPGKGTGLGLSISYSLISKQGGRITAESDPGKGSTFTVSLPPSDEKEP